MTHAHCVCLALVVIKHTNVTDLYFFTVVRLISVTYFHMTGGQSPSWIQVESLKIKYILYR